VAVSATLAISEEPMRHPALWEFDVRIHNDAAEPIRLSTAAMRGSLAFEVRDAAGGPVLLGPPPTPGADPSADVVTIDAGGSLSLRFHGDELLPDPPPPGRYELRFAATAPALGGGWSGRIESPWVAFAVAG
jgi:hypothetical protein